jgi:hypothetical protein
MLDGVSKALFNRKMYGKDILLGEASLSQLCEHIVADFFAGVGSTLCHSGPTEWFLRSHTPILPKIAGNPVHKPLYFSTERLNQGES